MIQPWDETLNKRGQHYAPITRPASTVALDALVEDSALLGGTLTNTGSSSLVNTVSAGSGNNYVAMAYSGDPTTSGIWAGNAFFAQSPFRVDLKGNLVANSAVITGTISTGTTGRRITLSGPTGSIIFYDQTNTITAYMYADSDKLILSEFANGTGGSLVIDSGLLATNISAPTNGAVFLSATDGVDTTTFAVEPTFSIFSGNTPVLFSQDISVGRNATITNQLLSNNFSTTRQVFTTTGTVSATAGAIIAFTGTLGGTLTLPAANFFGTPFSMQFKDEGNNTSVHNVILAAAGADTIEFSPTFTVNVSGVGITFYSDGVSAWYVTGVS